jgi:hypothetical protein
LIFPNADYRYNPLCLPFFKTLEARRKKVMPVRNAQSQGRKKGPNCLGGQLSTVYSVGGRRDQGYPHSTIKSFPFLELY